MGGFCLFVGSALLGYAGSGVGRVAHKGYRKIQEEKMEKVRREVERKMRIRPDRDDRGKESPGAALAAAGLMLLVLGAVASSVDP